MTAKKTPETARSGIWIQKYVNFTSTNQKWLILCNSTASYVWIDDSWWCVLECSRVHHTIVAVCSSCLLVFLHPTLALVPCNCTNDAYVHHIGSYRIITNTLPFVHVDVEAKKRTTNISQLSGSPHLVRDELSPKLLGIRYSMVSKLRGIRSTRKRIEFGIENCPFNYFWCT